MDAMVPLTEAKARLAELVREAADREVVLLRHGHPAAVLVSPERYEAMLEEIEDLRDRISVFESQESPADLRVSHDKLMAELGLQLKDGAGAGRPRSGPRAGRPSLGR